MNKVVDFKPKVSISQDLADRLGVMAWEYVDILRTARIETYGEREVSIEEMDRVVQAVNELYSDALAYEMPRISEF